MNFLFLIIGCLIGAIAIYIVLKPKLQTVQKLDEETIIENQQLRDQLIELTKEHSSLTSKKEEILANIATLQNNITTLQNNIAGLQEQAENTSNALYEKSYELANEKMNQAAKTMSDNYKKLEEAAKKEYLESLEDYTISFQQEIENKQNELEKVNLQLNDLTAKLDSAIEAAKRAEEIKLNQEFYRLQLSQADIDEIKRLREVTPYLRDSEPLNKVIWKVYYEKPYTDLIGRVVGNTSRTGIYKITNIENQMCYVGQAVNLADRFKQHIKRGIGAETPTRNKLYPAMLEYGVENFTFEIVEECERSKLNEREDYWQEYFHARDYGYSIK